MTCRVLRDILEGTCLTCRAWRDVPDSHAWRDLYNLACWKWHAWRDKFDITYCRNGFHETLLMWHSIHEWTNFTSTAFRDVCRDNADVTCMARSFWRDVLGVTCLTGCVWHIELDWTYQADVLEKTYLTGRAGSDVLDVMYLTMYLKKWVWWDKLMWHSIHEGTNLHSTAFRAMSVVTMLTCVTRRASETYLTWCACVFDDNFLTWPAWREVHERTRLTIRIWWRGELGMTGLIWCNWHNVPNEMDLAIYCWYGMLEVLQTLPVVRGLSNRCWYDVHDETSYMRSAWLDVLDHPCWTIRAWSARLHSILS
jgi:hypothetical protein